jgi:hypothetical protein
VRWRDMSDDDSRLIFHAGLRLLSMLQGPLRL